MNKSTLMLTVMLAMCSATTICAQTNSKTSKTTDSKTGAVPETVAAAVARPLPDPQPANMTAGRYDIVSTITSNGNHETIRVDMETGNTWIMDIDGRNRKAWVSLSKDGYAYRDETVRGAINYIIRTSGTETYLMNVNNGNTWALTYNGTTRKPYWETVR